MGLAFSFRGSRPDRGLGMHVTLCVRNLDGPVTQNESKPLKKHLKENMELLKGLLEVR